MRRTTSKASSLPVQWIKRDCTSAVAAACGVDLSRETVLALAATSVNPEDFHRAETFRRVYWRAEMWSKFPITGGEKERRDAAIASFRAAEAQCARTNSFLVDLWSDVRVPEGIRAVLWRAKRRLERLFDGFSVDEIVHGAKWGPGATTSLPAKVSTAANKWCFGHHCTVGALPYQAAFVRYTGWRPQFNVEIVPGNKVSFVAKNAKTDRSIAIEPDLNMFFQLGLGAAIRSRLQRWGILLPIAQDIHQRLARKGSEDRFLATVDLKGASDSISLALCEALLPPNVLEHILALRSPYGTMDDGESWFPYEKVSSMGNGFTFELETALFWAISSEVAGHASVYGDDIIVPSATVGFLQEVLSYCGFEFNEKKSHYGPRNPFRESCGGHYFDGHDVTPVYVRKKLTGVERLAFCNNLRRMIDGQRMYEFLPVWTAAQRGVPRVFRGPSHIDGVLHDDWDQCTPKWDAKFQCFTGLRLRRCYVGEGAPGLGALRGYLWDNRIMDVTLCPHLPRSQRPPEYAWQKDPGVPITKVGVWKSDNGYCWKVATPAWLRRTNKS